MYKDKTIKNKLKIFIIILLLLCISVLNHKFFNKHISNAKLDRVTLKTNNVINKNMFAVMIQKEDLSGYEQSDIIPNAKYFNSILSGCIDINGDEIDGTIQYDTTTKNIKLKTKGATYCYLYFDAAPPSDLYVSVSTDGTSDTVPTSPKYTKTINCRGNTATYSNKWNRLEISNFSTFPINCNMTYTTDSSSYPKLNDVIRVAGTSGNGSIVKYVLDSRYEGQNPNNYVWFNNELWRIIGSPKVYMDSTTMTTNYTKIIRNEPLGAITYDGKASGYTGAWGSNTLYTLLNSYYYGKKDATNTAYCYGYAATSKAKCNYTRDGIDPDGYYGKMLKYVYWFTGSSSYSVTAETAFSNEQATHTIGGYVGLMSLSDFGYASSGSKSTNISTYNNSTHTLGNWLYSHGLEWLITQYTTASNTDCIMYDGSVANNAANLALAVRPVVYLANEVYIISGTGTVTDPYIIGME